jgi:hypothetical protein
MITATFAPVNYSIDGLPPGPMLIFRGVTPIYLKVNFLKWCEIGLTEVGGSRQLEKTAIRHVQAEFPGFLDAVHGIALSMEGIETTAENLDRQVVCYYTKDARRRGVPNPFDCTVTFFNGITVRSMASMLWLLLEVATAHKEKYEYRQEPTELLNLFERFNIITTFGRDCQQCAQRYSASKKRPGSKKKKQ